MDVLSADAGSSSPQHRPRRRRHSAFQLHPRAHRSDLFVGTIARLPLHDPDTPRATVFVGGLSASDKRKVEGLSLVVLKSMSSLARTGFLVTFDAPVSIDPTTRLPL